jgi:MFS family permease
MKEQETEKETSAQTDGSFSEATTKTTKEHLIDFHINVGRVIKFLIITDLFFLGGWSLINPIFSVFIVNEIPGGTIAIAGFVAAMYWMIKSILQIPVANFLDRTEGEKDELYALLIALGLSAVAAFSFAIAQSVTQIFVSQAIYAIAMGLYVPSWTSLFSRHLDKNRTSFDWALNSTGMGLASCAAALLSGLLAAHMGYAFVFFLVGLASLAALFVILFIPDILLPKGKERKDMLAFFRNYFQHLHK